MTEPNLIGVFDRFLGVFKYRSTKRKEFFEAEVASLSKEFLTQLSYLISEIENARRAFNAEARNAEALLNANDSWEGLAAISLSLQQSLDGIEDRRQETRAKRMALQKTAQSRESHQYFESNILQFISEEERELTRELFSEINSYFVREQRIYSHDLAEPLKTVRFALEEVRELAKIGDSESKESILDHLVFCKNAFERARDRSQQAYARVESLSDKVRAVLQS